MTNDQNAIRILGAIVKTKFVTKPVIARKKTIIIARMPIAIAVFCAPTFTFKPSVFPITKSLAIAAADNTSAAKSNHLPIDELFFVMITAAAAITSRANSKPKYMLFSSRWITFS